MKYLRDEFLCLLEIHGDVGVYKLFGVYIRLSCVLEHCNKLQCTLHTVQILTKSHFRSYSKTPQVALGCTQFFRAPRNRPVTGPGWAVCLGRGEFFRLRKSHSLQKFFQRVIRLEKCIL